MNKAELVEAVQKTLGNLLGIAQLQGFVANETGLNIGPLICHSTYATLERDAGEWGKSDIEKLISLLVASNTEQYTALAERIRELYFNEICGGLSTARILQ